jgi:hypothetical protein
MSGEGIQGKKDQAVEQRIKEDSERKQFRDRTSTATTDSSSSSVRASRKLGRSSSREAYRKIKMKQRGFPPTKFF